MNLKSKLAATVIALGFAAAANAQASANGTATAVIVTPISIAPNATLNFGNIAVTTLGGAGTVTVSSAGARTKSGGVTFPAQTGSPIAGSFDVSGTANYTYAITLPANNTVVLTRVSGTETMAVNSFETNTASPQLNGSGNQTFNVGATLSVAANQAAGSYTGSYPVTVNYN